MFEFTHTPYMEKFLDGSTLKVNGLPVITIKKTANVGPSTGFYQNSVSMWPCKTLLASAIQVALLRGKHDK